MLRFSGGGGVGLPNVIFLNGGGAKKGERARLARLARLAWAPPGAGCAGCPRSLQEPPPARILRVGPVGVRPADGEGQCRLGAFGSSAGNFVRYHLARPSTMACMPTRGSARAANHANRSARCRSSNCPPPPSAASPASRTCASIPDGTRTPDPISPRFVLRHAKSAPKIVGRCLDPVSAAPVLCPVDRFVVDSGGGEPCLLINYEYFTMSGRS